MKKINLYEIGDELEAMGELMIADGGEVTEESEELMNYVQKLISGKTDGCVEYINRLDDELAMIDKRVADIAQHRLIVEKKKANFISYLEMCMNKMKVKKIQGMKHRMTMKKGSIKTTIFDEDKIPDEYKVKTVIPEKTEVKIPLKGLKEALQNGVEVPGATLTVGPQKLTYK